MNSFSPTKEDNHKSFYLRRQYDPNSVYLLKNKSIWNNQKPEVENPKILVEDLI